MSFVYCGVLNTGGSPKRITKVGEERGSTMAHKHKQVCAVIEPSTHVDACVCHAIERNKCNIPDATCKQRAVIAGSGPVTVHKAQVYDSRLAAAANKKQHQILADCKTQRPRCPHKIVKVPAAGDADRDSGQTQAGDGSRAECEIAQKVRGRDCLLCTHHRTSRYFFSTHNLAQAHLL